MQLFNPPKLTGKYLRQVLKSGWLTTGPMCQRLKEALAERLTVSDNQICLSSSATSAFQGIIDLLCSRYECIPRVYITTTTWPGLRMIVGRDCEFASSTKNADIAVLTDIGGRRFIDDREDIWEWPFSAHKVHDACHSWLPDLGADFAFMSFYPTKLVPGAEGGCVICRNSEDVEELSLWLYCGLSPGAAGNGVPPRCLGRKANMTDVQAALNLEALERAPQYIDDVHQAWLHLAYCALEMGIAFRAQPDRPYLFQIEVPHEQIPRVRVELVAQGIPSAWNFPPADLITLPCWPHMTAQDAKEILEKVRKIL